MPGIQKKDTVPKSVSEIEGKKSLQICQICKSKKKQKLKKE